jgi:hypothetical protein
MSAPKTVTEREAVLRERRAYILGLQDACWRDPETEEDAMARAEIDAARRYPLPRVTRPRVVRDPEHRPALWRLRNGALEVLIDGTESWHVYPRSGEGLKATGARLNVWADLLANPTETVEDDA